MNGKQLEWYLSFIRDEVNRLNEKEFVGNIDFKFNVKCGSITNMNIVLSKSVREVSVA